MIREILTLPRKVLISIATLIGAALAFALALPLLGGARDDAFARNGQLTADIANTNTAIAQAKSDIDFVKANQPKFEALVQSDRLVPHTRRAATTELEEIARANGFTTLNYSISAAASSTSPKAISTQPQSSAYRISVEDIKVRVGAQLDGPVYKFIAAITDAFPGSAVIQGFTLARVDRAKGGTAMRDKNGRLELVGGDIDISWRTAQAQEQAAAEAKK